MRTRWIAMVFFGFSLANYIRGTSQNPDLPDHWNIGGKN